MDLIIAIQNGDLYVHDRINNSFSKVDFPGKIAGAKYLPDILKLNFIDESGFLYDMKPDWSYSRHEDIHDVKDFFVCYNFIYVIKNDGKILSKKTDPFGIFGVNDLKDQHFEDIKLLGGDNTVKFENICGISNGAAVLIDEFGNLWSNLIYMIPDNIFSQITKDIVFINAFVSMNMISAIDIDGNPYAFTFTYITDLHIDSTKIDVLSLKFLQCGSFENNLYLIDDNYHLWVGDLYGDTPFRIIKNDVTSMAFIQDKIYILLTDGTLMEYIPGNEETFNVISDIKFDKLPNIMNSNVLRRFAKTKSSRKITNVYLS